MKNKYFITLAVILAVIGIFIASINLESDRNILADTDLQDSTQIPVQTAAVQPDTIPAEQEQVYSVKKYSYLPNVGDYSAPEGVEGIYSESYEEVVNPAAARR